MKNKFNIFFITLLLFFFITMINSSSIYIKWLFLEFSTMLLISMINIKYENKIVSIMYYMVSSMSTLLTIIFISFNYSQLFIIKNDYLNLMLMISLFMKIGTFPFIYWMINIYLASSWGQIFIISTLMKFIPMFFFSSMMYHTPMFFLIMFLNNLFISLYTNLEFSLKKLFGCSSIFNSFFFLYIIQINITYFIFLSLMYIILLFMIMSILDFYNINNYQNFNNLTKKSINMFIFLMFMYSSFPLFITFMFKWKFIYLMNKIFSNNLIIILLLMSMFMIWNYFTLFKTLFLKFKYSKMYKKNEMFNYMMFIPLMISFYSMMFLMFNLI
nr:TPA_asm: ND2 [Bombus trifasciatus]